MPVMKLGSHVDIGSSGDCCTPRLPWGDVDIRGILERAVVTTTKTLTVRYVSIADLIGMRLAVGRPKDLRRVDELTLLRAQRPT